VPARERIMNASRHDLGDSPTIDMRSLRGLTGPVHAWLGAASNRRPVAAMVKIAFEIAAEIAIPRIG